MTSACGGNLLSIYLCEIIMTSKVIAFLTDVPLIECGHCSLFRVSYNEMVKHHLATVPQPETSSLSPSRDVAC